MSAFTQKVIGRIKQEGIVPDAGWKFTAKRSLLWVGIVLAGGIAALSLSMIVLSFLSIDRSPLTFPLKRFFSFAFFRSLPFFWGGLLIAFSTLVVLEFRNTRHGYRHRMATVAVLSGIVIVIGASILSAWGADERAERMMKNRFPHYAEMSELREKFWSRPEEGFLSGIITGSAEGVITLIDGEGTRWRVILKDTTIVRPLVRIEERAAVKILGEARGDHDFEAEEIRPWDRPEKPMMPGMMRGRELTR